MSVIENVDQLIAAAARSGVTIDRIQATLALKYFDDNDERITQHNGYKLWLAPVGDLDDGYDYNITELFEVAREYAEEAYNEACSKEKIDDDLLLRISEDEYILKLATEQAKQIVPVTIKNYAVNIIQYLKMTVYVDAASISEAEETVKKNYKEGLYGELSPSLHGCGTMVSVVSSSPR